MTDQRGRGRPPIGKTVTARLPDDLWRAVERYADTFEVPKAEAVRRLLAGGIEALGG